MEVEEEEEERSIPRDKAEREGREKEREKRKRRTQLETLELISRIKGKALLEKKRKSERRQDCYVYKATKENSQRRYRESSNKGVWKKKKSQSVKRRSSRVQSSLACKWRFCGQAAPDNKSMTIG